MSRVHTTLDSPRKGDTVRKRTGDYKFDGIVVAKFKKLNGKTRYVVEDKRGLCLIMNAEQVKG